MSILEHSVLSLPSLTLRKLVYALTVESPLDPPRDWRGLGGYLGFPHRIITLIEQHRESSKAWQVLKLWDQTGTSSVGKLLIALMELSLIECVDILRADLGDVFLMYESTVKYWKQLKETSDVQTCLFKPLTEENLLLYPEMISDGADTTLNSGGNLAPATAVSLSRPVHRSVYISYVPDRSHKRQLLSLIQALKDEGFNVYCEETCKNDIKSLGRGLDYWKEQCILGSESFLVLCTKKYCQEDQKKMIAKSPIAVDRHFARYFVYHGDSQRVVPVMLEKSCPLSLPLWLASLGKFNWPEQKFQLLRCLCGVPEYERPPVEQKLYLKPIQINFPAADKWNIDE